MLRDPDWIGKTNPLYEIVSNDYKDCDGCGEALYDEEIIRGENGDFCAECTALNISETLHDVDVECIESNLERFVFKIKRRNV